MVGKTIVLFTSKLLILFALLPVSEAGEPEQSAADVLAKLKKQLKDPDDQVREKAVMAISSLGSLGGSLVPDFVEILEKDKAPNVRLAVVNGIRGMYFRGVGDLPDARLIKALIRAMQKDEDTVVRWRACESFGAIGRRANEAAPFLVDLILAKEDDKLREMARSSLFLISGPECKVISPRLIEVLSKSKPDYETLSIFLRVLGKIGENEDIVVPILIKALREKSHDGRDTCGDAALALGYMGPKAKKAVPNLIESLTDADRRGSRGLTVLTLEALGRIGPDARDAVPLIRSIASSSSSAIVRAQAEKALKRIGRGRLEI